MSKDELIIQLVKVALGIPIGGYFLWWSLEILNRLPPLTSEASAVSASDASASVATKQSKVAILASRARHAVALAVLRSGDIVPPAFTR